MVNDTCECVGGYTGIRCSIAAAAAPSTHVPTATPSSSPLGGSPTAAPTATITTTMTPTLSPIGSMTQPPTNATASGSNVPDTVSVGGIFVVWTGFIFVAFA